MDLSGRNIFFHLRQRERQSQLYKQIKRVHHVNESHIRRLGLETELQGHRGCVNCLEWNEDGSLLGSGSDDLHAIIWDAHRHRQMCTLSTGHNGNIFSIKFLPNSGNLTVVTGAADCKVRVHCVPKLKTSSVYSCHAGRVKRLATAPNVPYMFWSAGEDGTIRQIDLRTNHNCTESCSNVLVNLNEYIGKHAECKCLAINHHRPEQLAVGASDPYVRLYDIRMLSTHSVSFKYPDRLGNTWLSPCPEPDENGTVPRGCVQYFVAGHLPVKENGRRRGFRTLAVTYLTFDPSGRELLVNIGGEQVYLYDLYNPQKPKLFNPGEYAVPSENLNGICKKDIVSEQVAGMLGANGTSTNGVSKHVHMAHHTNGFRQDVGQSCHSTAPSSVQAYPNQTRSKELPMQAVLLKLEANRNYCEKKDYPAAIRLYNQAIAIAPDSAILYGNRAAAYMKRRWDGDLYASIRDCHSALSLDPTHRKAHFRLARCLLDIALVKEAEVCMQHLKMKFPDYAKYKELSALESDLKGALESADNDTDSSETDSKSDSPTRLRNMQTILSDHEQEIRGEAFDYKERFCGHCNTTTDIKEANFFGSDGNYIMAGSDDGSFFVWDRKTTNIVRVMRGDDSIVNCLQPHPTTCLLASSGIDPVIRLWSPRPEDGSVDERCILEEDTAASANQRRMKADPLEVMLINMGLPAAAAASVDEEGMQEGGVQCRPS